MIPPWAPRSTRWGRRSASSPEPASSTRISTSAPSGHPLPGNSRSSTAWPEGTVGRGFLSAPPPRQSRGWWSSSLHALMILYFYTVSAKRARAFLARRRTAETPCPTYRTSRKNFGRRPWPAFFQSRTNVRPDSVSATGAVIAGKWPGGDLLSRANCTLSSAQARFTVLFGMGRRGSRLLWPPDGKGIRKKQNSGVRDCTHRHAPTVIGSSRTGN